VTAGTGTSPGAVDLDEDVPGWMRVATLVLAVAGLVAAAYLTFEHVTSSTSLACPDTGRISCAKVTTSSYSSFLGIPVAVLGLVYFVVLVALVLPAAWRSVGPRVHRLRLAWVSVGMLSVLYLVWAELFGVRAICLWCTGVHVVTTLVFGLVVFAEAYRPSSRR
jgi:uncharacterized membrane protein